MCVHGHVCVCVHYGVSTMEVREKILGILENASLSLSMDLLVIRCGH